MNIDSIRNGVVIDHIKAGSGMRLCRLLGLDDTELTVAIIRNVTSAKMGRKDIIKIDSVTSVNLDLIGYVDPGATVNIIRNGQVSEKLSLDFPEKLVNVIQCKNPRCITSCEQELPHIFRLTDRKSGEYRCIYCETKA
ncbi:MAG: aspartate carbamoyltransferase regulatory subunit [Clostridia bacterium]|jgi:aspartate carbamoyltransferase regulatory subunit|nr:aspartate carbamoyltransferase regulatory subunit [Clostridia bacterium]